MSFSGTKINDTSPPAYRSCDPHQPPVLRTARSKLSRAAVAASRRNAGYPGPTLGRHPTPGMAIISAPNFREPVRYSRAYRRPSHNSREQQVRMKPQQPPNDALLWRVATDHTEVVCFVVAACDRGVALCVERNEELMVAESYASLERVIERSQELRAELGAIGLPDEGNN